jgi:RNA polymerase sigma-70 factor (ECF subfamily)
MLNSGTPIGGRHPVTSICAVSPRGTSNAGISCKPAAISARFLIVSGSNHEHLDVTAAAGTLGDLLYADPAKPRVSETEWRKLIQAVGAGDQLALQTFYDRTHRLVYTLTMRILGNHATAEEVTLDVFHEIWRRASTYDAKGGSVLGWVMNQAHSRAIDRLRFEGRKKRNHSVVADPQAQTSSMDLSAKGPQQAQLLQQALQALTPDERKAVETAYFSELTYVEVAARLNEPVGTIKTRIRSALGKLRRALTTGDTR